MAFAQLANALRACVDRPSFYLVPRRNLFALRINCRQKMLPQVATIHCECREKQPKQVLILTSRHSPLSDGSGFLYLVHVAVVRQRQAFALAWT